ncbi:LPS export ABC transporter periplasmic protein LptC, partial [Salmonella enterica subsp. enterica]|nr:LPS export ABC transporter periplasmic protein LptC [Salmonella enterica subsp. enterica]
MSTKTLFILGLLFIMVSTYFYAQNDARLTQVSLKPTDIDYQAEQIKALQT